VSNIVPVLHLLGLPLTAGVPEVLEAIKAQQRQMDTQKRKADAMEEAWATEHARVQRAENPDNWRATWAGDPSTEDVDTTVLDHGNLITLDHGTGQVLMHFRPCCQNLRCECTRRQFPGGYCDCHENDE
jgi:hypothetical protein